MAVKADMGQHNFPSSICTGQKPEDNQSFPFTITIFLNYHDKIIIRLYSSPGGPFDFCTPKLGMGQSSKLTAKHARIYGGGARGPGPPRSFKNFYKFLLFSKCHN